MGFSDLHIHSAYSYDGTASISAIMRHIIGKTNLNVIAITDHDTVKGVHEAQDLAPRYGLEVIPGIEISSADGHVLGLWVEKAIPAGLSLRETLLRVGEQGGYCIAAHPEARGIHSLSFSKIREVLMDADAARVLVAVEALNGSLVFTSRNETVSNESRKLSISLAGNSDAHTLEMIGSGSSYFEGKTAEDLKYALLNHLTLPYRQKGPKGAAVATTYVPQIIMRKLGWVKWSQGPENAIRYTQLSRAIQTVGFPAA